MLDMLQGEVTSIALCWQIERADGAGLALTTHDQDLILGTITHEAAPGMLPAAIQRKLGLEPNSGEIAGAITSASLDEMDLAEGRWDGAQVELTIADWNEPGAEVLPVLQGELGEVRLERGEFKAELRGAATRLEAPVCPETSPECRAELGDKRCRIDLAGRTLMATITQVVGRELVLDRSVGTEFLWGRARFVTGPNCGLASAVVGVADSRIQLRDTNRAEILPGDRIEIRHGCDKSFATCIARFANAANFRGEPHLPGNDLLTRYPGA